MASGVSVTVSGGFEHDGAWRRQLWLRPWSGRDEVLLYDQAGLAGPAARATALLARCVSLDGRRPAGSDFVRQLTVGDRESLLLQLYGLTVGERLNCLLLCPACGERMDLELRIAELLTGPGTHDGWQHDATFDAGGCRYRAVFRLPNGGDQEIGAAMVGGGEQHAVQFVLRRCIDTLSREDGTLEEGISDSVAAELSRLMADLDPQAELMIDTRCVRCSAPIRSLLDAAHYVLNEAGVGAESLFRHVHALAAAFHWSEAEILAMSSRRRHKYMELLRGGANG